MAVRSECGISREVFLSTVIGRAGVQQDVPALF